MLFSSPSRQTNKVVDIIYLVIVSDITNAGTIIAVLDITDEDKFDGFSSGKLS